MRPFRFQGGNEYCYDLTKAKKGHLPLTSALRGTYRENPSRTRLSP